MHNQFIHILSAKQTRYKKTKVLNVYESPQLRIDSVTNRPVL
jgi:hypothetical protein